MRQYERSGVIIDQCQECRGIFLDRGELERLADAENAYHGRPAPAPAAQGYDQRSGYDQRGSYEQQRHYEHRDRDQHHHKKKKHSFFEELFD
jgi:Zn-finger nucleic acid-binding protein